MPTPSATGSAHGRRRTEVRLRRTRRPGTIGLTHMLEHFLFKGSDLAGTTDWKAEQAIAESIERLEREITDEKNRNRDCFRQRDVFALLGERTGDALRHFVDLVGHQLSELVVIGAIGLAWQRGLIKDTNDFARDYEAMRSHGVVFVRPPNVAPYGTVAVFEDLYGNLWDLVQPNENNRSWQMCCAFRPTRSPPGRTGCSWTPRC